MKKPITKSNISEQDIDKKAWIKPEIEIISQYIESGASLAYHEGKFAKGSVAFYVFAS